MYNDLRQCHTKNLVQTHLSKRDQNSGNSVWKRDIKINLNLADRARRYKAARYIISL